MFGFYIRNNIGVAFQCFAGGLFAGVGSLFFLAYNGAFGGAVAGYLTERGLSPTFYLVRRDALGVRADGDRAVRRRRPAHRTRAAGAGPADAACRRWSQAARESVVILYGVTRMLLIAAAIEAFWSSATLAAARRQVQRRGRLLDRACSATSCCQGRRAG